MKWYFHILAILAPMIVVSLAGCGSNTPSTTPTAVKAPAAVEKPKPAPEKVKPTEPAKVNAAQEKSKAEEVNAAATSQDTTEKNGKNSVPVAKVEGSKLPP